MFWSGSLSRSVHAAAAVEIGGDADMLDAVEALEQVDHRARGVVAAGQADAEHGHRGSSGLRCAQARQRQAKRA